MKENSTHENAGGGQLRVLLKDCLSESRVWVSLKKCDYLVTGAHSEKQQTATCAQQTETADIFERLRLGRVLEKEAAKSREARKRWTTEKNEKVEKGDGSGSSSTTTTFTKRKRSRLQCEMTLEDDVRIELQNVEVKSPSAMLLQVAPK